MGDHAGRGSARVLQRAVRLLTPFAVDVGIGLIVAAMIITALLFSSGVSRFVYIDF